jgi:ABC-type polysaccharide/polyol phosphate transport system ATPase subunit
MRALDETAAETAPAPPPLAVDAPARPLAPPDTPPIIVADQVWKGYRHRARRVRLRYEASAFLKRLARRAVAPPPPPFWALRDVSFAVRAGEAVALIGRNGSGKTTLLRVLSGITKPTRGQTAVGGRFATLIALGAGFDRERTGRENIVLNAAIQGVEPRQVAAVLDDIVAFAEIGEFIDAPVKSYSSGMGARLGFSIAVHIAPEILFIDETLSVGDEAFQQKCVERVLELKAEGRTIVFVSHEKELVRRICDRALWLDRGRLRFDGPVAEALDRYHEAMQQEPRERGGSGRRGRRRAIADVGR